MTAIPKARWRLVAAASLLIILATTLRTNPAQVDQAAATSWRCLVCGEAGVTDVLLNLLLFAPLGLSLGRLGWPAQHAIPLMIALTLGIECSQAFFLAGRDASLSDVLANSLGGAVGFGFALRSWSFGASHPQGSRRRAAAILTLSASIWLATGWALHPDGATTAPWVGQWMHVRRGQDPFAGAVVEATLNGIAVPNDPVDPIPSLSDSTVLRLTLLRRDSRLPLRPVSILRIVDGRGATLLGVDQRGDALHVGLRLRASRFLVRTPVWSFEHVIRRMPPGTPWHGAWRWRADGVELRGGVANGPETTVDRIPLSAGLGWAFVHPFAAVIGPLAPWWTGIWLLLVSAPLGWMLARLRGVETLGWAVAAALAFAAASWATNTPVNPREIIELIGAVILGRLAGERWAPRAPTASESRRTAPDR